MRDGAWHEWWNSGAAPVTYDERNALLAPLVEWRSVAAGIETGTLRISGSGEAWRLRVVLARVDPALVEFVPVPTNGIGRKSWTIDSMSSDAVLAISTGQFKTARVPWGWLVIDGVERQPPSDAPLGMAVVIDSSGHFQLMARTEVNAARARPGGSHARIAFQSYPVALIDGAVPWRLQAERRGVDLAHRDGRLGICTLSDGRVLVTLTRFDALNGEAPELPFGTTVPEMVAVMGNLGCRRALMLDGGISRQFGLREHDSLTVRHKGWRSIPMGLEAKLRTPAS
jgi:exopolysaccharide biosynthesis protein